MFFDLDLKEEVVNFDTASAIWQEAARHSIPALTFVHHLNYLHLLCCWKLRVYFDGCENGEKRAKAKRRRVRSDAATEAHDDIGQIKNTPEYIAEAMQV